METLFFQTASGNLLLDFMPDALGLLIFGIGLIVLAAGLRRLFNRREEVESEGFSGNVHRTVS